MRTISEGTSLASAQALIDRKQLLKLVPLSDRTIFNLEKRGEFPQRLAITPRRVAWYLNEVTEWMEKRRHQKPVMPLSFLR
jgi:prophage regulatory protein